MSETRKKHILLLGVGGTGSNAVDQLYAKIRELGNLSGNQITAIVFDTDTRDINGIQNATKIPLADSHKLGFVVDSLPAAALADWFPIDDPKYRDQEMSEGAAQWRKKSYLAFYNMMRKEGDTFCKALDALKDRGSTDTTYEIYTVASIAGGTGSGSFIPITLFAKRYLKLHLDIEVQAYAMLACPDIYADTIRDDDQKVKIYANAYAILRELNAMNLVANSQYNNPEKGKIKHAPVRFHLGSTDSDDPIGKKVGKLFDSEDEQYGKSEAAPFHTVYLLDKMPALGSVRAHDSILANSLYTIMCTEIGATFGSGNSNALGTKSQSNNGNAIYAGIATSQIRYPYDAIATYMATQKAYDSSQGEWTLLHRETERRIADEMQLAADMRQTYTPKHGDYSAKFLLSVEEELRDPYTEVSQVVRRGLDLDSEEESVKVGGVKKDRVDEYFTQLLSNITERLQHASAEELKELLDSSREIVDRPTLFMSGSAKQALRTKVRKHAQAYYELLSDFYSNSVTVIRQSARSIADAILPVAFDKKHDANTTFSLTENLLKKNGLYVHPVTAMVLLCKLQRKLMEKTPRNFVVWSDIKAFTAPEMPMDFLKSTGKNESGSEYGKMGTAAFRTLADPIASPTEYLSHNSDTSADSRLLIADARFSMDELQKEAHNQLYYAVLSLVEERVDKLIAKYRSFFLGFEKARVGLKVKLADAKRASGSTQGDVINLCATPEEKEAAYAEYMKKAGPGSMDDLLAADDVNGGAVFAVNFDSLRAEMSDAKVAIPGDTYSRLFDAMVESCRKQIVKSDTYATMSQSSIIEVIKDACGVGAPVSDIVEKVKDCLRQAIEYARPSLNPTSMVSESRVAKQDTVIMLSRGVAKYLLEHAEEYGINPVDERAAVDDFLAKAITGGNSSIYSSIVDGIPNGIIYVTRKVDNVHPVQISKINELSPNATYFQNYQEAIRRMVKYETDMWNPHLGNSLHLRGYLPYINDEKEAQEDAAFAKAFLYGILKAKFTYHARSIRAPRNIFWYNNEGREAAIMVPDENGSLEEVTVTEMFKLLSWLRNQADLIAEWSEAYDAWVKTECRSLRPVITNEDADKIKSEITGCSLIKKFREDIFSDVTRNANAEPAPEGSRRSSSKNTLSCSLLELVYKIKMQEESYRDCDDAEKILRVGFDTLVEFCFYRFSEQDEARREEVYIQQWMKFLSELFKDADTPKDKNDAFIYVESILGWACKVAWKNGNNCFTLPDRPGKPWNAPDRALLEAAYENAVRETSKPAGKAVASAGTPAAGPVDEVPTVSEEPIE